MLLLRLEAAAYFPLPDVNMLKRPNRIIIDTGCSLIWRRRKQETDTSKRWYLIQILQSNFDQRNSTYTVLQLWECLNIAIVIDAIVELSNFTCAHQDDGLQMGKQLFLLTYI